MKTILMKLIYSISFSNVVEGCDMNRVGQEQVDPLIPLSDQDRISPYNINTISTR